MPPPTAGEAWLTSRKFGIVIDAGSSGSRLQIYSWKDPRSTLAVGDPTLLTTLPKVEKGVQFGEEWVSKVEPGACHHWSSRLSMLNLCMHLYFRPLIIRE